MTEFPKSLLNKIKHLTQKAIRINFQSDTDHLNINGLFVNALNQPTPSEKCIVLCHGRNEPYPLFFARYVDLIEKFLNNGFNLLLFDFRGHGHSSSAIYSYGYFEQRDVLGAFHYLKENQPQITKIGVLGFSIGAMAAMLAIEKHPGIKALVCESGYSSFEKVANMPDPSGDFWIPKGTPAHQEAVNKHKKEMGWDFNISAIEDIQKISPCALFLIDGDQESEDNQYMYEKALEPKKIWLIPNASHGEVYSVAKEEYEKKVLTFFQEYL